MIRIVGGALVAMALTISSALAGPYLFELMEIKSYRASWMAMFEGRADVPDWIAEFTSNGNGVAGPSEDVAIDTGRPYVYANVCKPHDCGDNMLHVLFAPQGAQAWSLLVTPAGTSWFGDPDAAVQAALEAKARAN